MSETSETIIFGMSQKDMIQILKNQIIDFFQTAQCCKTYILPNYHFDNKLKGNLEILSCFINTYNTSTPNYLLAFSPPSEWKGTPASMFTKVFKDIEELLTFVMFQFRDTFTYSKVTDTIENKEDIVLSEKVAVATEYLTTYYNNETEFQENNMCCACLDFTLTKTKCNHGLCRFCYDKIIPSNKDTEMDLCFCKHCPLCRECLSTDEDM